MLTCPLYVDWEGLGPSLSSAIAVKQANCLEICNPEHVQQKTGKVCTISFERPVNYLCDAWHVFPPKYEACTHFNRPWTEYQCQGVVWTLLIIFTESVNRSTCVSVYLIITRLRNVNLLCFSDSIEGIDFLNCTLKCPVTLKLANQIAISANCSSALFSNKETPIYPWQWS